MLFKNNNQTAKIMNDYVNLFRVFQQEEAYFEAIADNKTAKNTISKQTLVVFGFLLLYGIIMGSYNSFVQCIATGLKMPVLVFLSLLICFPAFYAIQFMIGSRLSLIQMLSIVLSGFIVFSTIAVSFSPIIVFFMVTGDNYSFIKLLHVTILAFSGIFAMRTIIRGLRHSCEKMNVYPKLGLKVFKIWILIFAFVGMQLGWNLRPFVGSRDMPFELFRAKEGNFYLAVIQSVGDIFNGEEDEDNKKETKEPLQTPPVKHPDNDSTQRDTESLNG